MNTTQYIILSLLLAITPGMSILIYSILPYILKNKISIYIFTLLVSIIFLSTFYFCIKTY